MCHYFGLSKQERTNKDLIVGGRGLDVELDGGRLSGSAMVQGQCAVLIWRIQVVGRT